MSDDTEAPRKLFEDMELAIHLVTPLGGECVRDSRNYACVPSVKQVLAYEQACLNRLTETDLVSQQITGSNVGDDAPDCLDLVGVHFDGR
jgi:hypothetical protein